MNLKHRLMNVNPSLLKRRRLKKNLMLIHFQGARCLIYKICFQDFKKLTTAENISLRGTRNPYPEL